MRVISVYFRLNLCKLYDGQIRLLADHDFIVQVELIARGRGGGTFNPSKKT